MSYECCGDSRRTGEAFADAVSALIRKFLQLTTLTFDHCSNLNNNQCALFISLTIIVIAAIMRFGIRLFRG